MKTLSIVAYKPFLKINIRSAKTLQKSAETALRSADKKTKEILDPLKGSGRSSLATLRLFNDVDAILSETRSRASLLAAVHPDQKIRTAAEGVMKKISRFSSAFSLDPQIYAVLKKISPEGLDEEARRFLKKEILDFTLSGVDKPERVRREIKKLADKGVKISQQFDRNIKDDVRYLTISSAELEGLPEDYKASHLPDKKGKVRISTQYPDYYPFMQYAKSDNARRALYMLFNNRGWPKNDAVFRQLLALRQRRARLVGYSTWADYVTADKMTGSAKTVQRFIDELATIVKKSSERDIKILLERKRKDHPGARSLDNWELGYYENLFAKEYIGLDTQEVRNYFPFSQVKQGVLEAAARLFGLSYRRVYPPTWHPDVEAYDAYRKGKKIGRFYLDMHPRKGKYGHAACFDIRLGLRGIQFPEAALVCNFSKDLMSQGEVETFFHEFGHLIHCLLAGDQQWLRFNGFGVEWDFVEAPSQMLEEWALDYPTLKRFARNQKTGKRIPEALVKKMRTADKFGRGISIRRQNFYSALSLRYHEESDPRHADLMKILRRVQKKYDILEYPAGTHFFAGFGHLNEYSAIYYTYMWSRAIAEEILSPFKKAGMYDRRVAARYMDEVLVPGGSKDASQLIHNFLRRDWNLKTFKRWLEE